MMLVAQQGGDDLRIEMIGKMEVRFREKSCREVKMCPTEESMMIEV